MQSNAELRNWDPECRQLTRIREYNLELGVEMGIHSRARNVINEIRSALGVGSRIQKVGYVIQGGVRSPKTS